MIWRAFYSTCAGIFTFVFAAIIFWYFLPDAGLIHQYVNVAICTSFGFLVGRHTYQNDDW